jgi:hypothetical protein
MSLDFLKITLMGMICPESLREESATPEARGKYDFR